MPYAMRPTVIALAALLSAGPVSAQVGRCSMATETKGGVVNSHTMPVAIRLLPAVVGPDTQPSTLADRMRALDVPGVSVAVIHYGRIAWARGRGVGDVASCRPVRRRAPMSASAATSIYLRGAMNGWSTATPLVREDAGWTLTTAVAPGDYKFKLGSGDWRAADYGTSTGESATIGAPSVPLVSHGGNVSLTVTRRANYRFLLRVDQNGRALLAINEVVLP